MRRAIATASIATFSLLATACEPIVQPPVPRALSDLGRHALSSSVSTTDSFWTNDRIRTALHRNTAVDTTDPKLSDVGLGEGDAGTGYNFAGIPQLGTFFYTSSPGTTVDYHTCSGAVANSATGTIVLSAAHCWAGVDAQDVVFIPAFAWVNGVPRTPYGIWKLTGSTLLLDPRYESGADDSMAYDVAVAAIAPNSANQTIQEVTGGFDLTLNASTTQVNVEILGYPASDSDDQTYTAAYARHCRNNTTTYTEAGVDFFDILCTGMASGVSGGPWLVKDGSSWSIVAVTGGGQDGGGYTNDESVGVPLRSFVTELIAKAENYDADAAHDWSRVTTMTAGHFGALAGADDLAVGWLDNSSTLILGTGEADRPFLGEREIFSASSATVPIRSATTADLDASGHDDLVILKTDGTLWLYQDPGVAVGHPPLHLNPNEPVKWTHAQEIVGGDFSPDGDGAKDDLLVVWDDGSTSVYLHISWNGIGRPAPWPPGGLRGLRGSDGGSDGALADGIDGYVTAGYFGGGELTDLMVVQPATDTAWLLTDSEPEGRMPVYEISPLDLSHTGIAASEVIGIAAGDFTSTTTYSDVMVNLKGKRLDLLSDVSTEAAPTDVTTIATGN